MQSFLRAMVWLGAILGAIGLLLYLFVFDTWLVPGDDLVFAASIAPTLRPQDRILVQRGTPPNLGQLARCQSPVNPSQFVVGRVMGMRGDTVEVRDERVVVDGKSVVSRHGCPPVAIVHPATGETIELLCSVEENPAWTYQVLIAREFPEGNHSMKVDEGKLYLVSDNRHLHYDTRDFGAVDASTCEHVVFRLWGASFIDSSRRFSILW